MNDDPSWYRYDAAKGRLSVTLHVQPNARRTEVVGLHGEALKLRIAAPAVDSKANIELITYLSETLLVAKSSISIRRGATGRRKVVEIAGGSELAARLDTLRQSREKV